MSAVTDEKETAGDPDAATEGQEADPVAHLKTLQAHHAQAAAAGNAKAKRYFKAEIDAHIAKHTAATREMQMLQQGMAARKPAAAPTAAKIPAEKL
jgi:hypothetical protein